MSDNYRHYADKTNRRHQTAVAEGQRRRDLEELLAVVRRCEAIWAIEDRIERSR